MTITDADLERLLSFAAAEYAVPDDGIESVLAAERAPRVEKARRADRGRRAWAAPSRLAVVLAVLAVLGIFVGGVVTAGSGKHPTAASAGADLPADGNVLHTAQGLRTGPESMPTFAAASPAPYGKFAAAAPAVTAPLPAGAVADSGTTSTGTSGSADDALAAPSAGALAGLTPASGAGTAQTAGGSVPAAAADAGADDSAKIVRTGQADLTVAKGAVPTAQDKLESLATTYGGYVADERTTGGDYPSTTVTLRVPGNQFSALVADVQKIGTVADLSTQAADVTSQYTDLTARIHALETQRDTYLTLLSKASSISETLAVQQRVDSVQTQLEQLQGQQKVLDDQTSYGSLSVTVTQVGQPVITTTVPQPRTGFSKAWHDAKHRFNGGVQGLVAASGPVAFIVVVALVAWAVWLLVRRRLQRARV